MVVQSCRGVLLVYHFGVSRCYWAFAGGGSYFGVRNYGILDSVGAFCLSLELTSVMESDLLVLGG